MKGIIGALVGMGFILASFVCRGEGPRRVSVLGDSYSTFLGGVEPDSNLVWYVDRVDLNRTDVNSVEQTWWHRLLQERGWELERNNSFSGATICYTGYHGEDYTNRSFVNRASELGNPDLILVFGGTNDSWAHSPLGEFRFGGCSEEELKSVRPATEEMLARLERFYPEAEKVVIVNDILSGEITQALESLAVLHGMKVVMLEGIDKQNGHPTSRGMEEIARQVGAVVN